MTAVNATLEPYNPAVTDHGLPAERVRFTVETVTGGFTCRLAVRRGDRIVGATTAGFGLAPRHSGPVRESVSVAVTGTTFSGSPRDAAVTCGRP